MTKNIWVISNTHFQHENILSLEELRDKKEKEHSEDPMFG